MRAPLPYDAFKLFLNAFSIYLLREMRSISASTEISLCDSDPVIPSISSIHNGLEVMNTRFSFVIWYIFKIVQLCIGAGSC